MLENEGATPEVEQEIVVEEPKSMDDTIRETLRGLQEKGIKPDPVETTPEAPEDKAARLRDEKGKFAAKEGVPVVPDEVIPAEPVEKTATVRAAPNTWRKEAQEKWATLPPEIQAEVEKREADMHKGIEGYRQAAQFAQTIQSVVAPHMNTIQQLGITPEKAIDELLKSDYKLRYGTPQEKVAHLAFLAHNYGIDMGSAYQQHASVDPNVYALQAENARLKASKEQHELMVQQQAEQALNSEIAAFAADPSHSHFESVKGHMSALLQAGQAKDLADAYEQAIYANPTTRDAVLQQRAQVQREEAAKKAQAAKEAASVNVRARPSMPVSQPIGSMDDTIRDVLRKHGMSH